jgi:hypothetical protein
MLLSEGIQFDKSIYYDSNYINILQKQNYGYSKKRSVVAMH